MSGLWGAPHLLPCLRRPPSALLLTQQAGQAAGPALAQGPNAATCHPDGSGRPSTPAAELRVGPWGQCLPGSKLFAKSPFLFFW